MEKLFLCILFLCYFFAVLLPVDVETLRAALVGYVGPPCVVVDSHLFLHGSYARNLDDNEVDEFFNYQQRLEIIRLLNDAKAKGVAEVPEKTLLTPESPSFCAGLSNEGAPEVVLGEQCIVRNGTVYSDDSSRQLEHHQIAQIQELVHFSLQQNPAEEARFRRHSDQLNSAAPPKFDVVGLLSHFLNVNASVVERLMPMFESSPLVKHFRSPASLAGLFNDPGVIISTSEKTQTASETLPSSDRQQKLKSDQNGTNPKERNDEAEKLSFQLTENDNKNFSESPKGNPSQNNVIEDQISDLERRTLQSQNDSDGDEDDAEDEGLVRALLKTLMNRRQQHQLSPQQQQQFHYPQSAEQPLPPSIANTVEYSGYPTFQQIARRPSRHMVRHVNFDESMPPLVNPLFSPAAGTEAMMSGTSNKLRPGDTVLIGGQLYIAVPINQMILPQQLTTTSPSATTTKESQRQEEPMGGNIPSAPSTLHQTSTTIGGGGDGSGVGLMPAKTGGKTNQSTTRRRYHPATTAVERETAAHSRRQRILSKLALELCPFEGKKKK